MKRARLDKGTHALKVMEAIKQIHVVDFWIQTCVTRCADLANIDALPCEVCDDLVEPFTRVLSLHVDFAVGGVNDLFVFWLLRDIKTGTSSDNTNYHTTIKLAP